MTRSTATCTPLRDVPAFARCSRKEVSFITSKLTGYRARAGEILLREGDRGREFFLVSDGSVTVKVGDREIAHLGAGAIVGEMALLGHRPRSATVIADCDMRIEVGSRSEFDDLLFGAPAFRSALSEALATRGSDLDLDH